MAKGNGEAAAVVSPAQRKGKWAMSPPAAAAAAEEEAGNREESKESGRMIRLRSNDGELVEVAEASARQSKLIEEMIDSGNADPSIPLPNVDSKTLAMVIQYCDKHAAAAAAADTTEAKDLKAWDDGFVHKLDMSGPLFDVIAAADYLNMDGLLDLACKRVADEIKDKTPEEIREAFNIVNDLSEEEEEAIRLEHAWAFEYE
uniref:SKP1-like protein n=1 Tax=Leersia perrieri TaxID=77586 RepID=A0A0D9X1Q1_9ORYZ